VILTYIDCDTPCIILTDSLDVAITRILSQNFNEGKILPCSVICRKQSPAEFNYEAYDKNVRVIVYSSIEWKHCVQRMEPKLTAFSNHQKL